MSQIVFPGVIGQLEIQRQLVGMVQQNRLGHAIILLGPEGSGTLPLAVGFGQYVVSHPQLKRKPVMVADLFGGISALPVDEEEASMVDTFTDFDQKALGFVHPDLHFSYPVIKRNPDKDSPPVSADWAEEWRMFLKETPYGNLYDWLQHIKAENKQGNITAKECTEIIHKLSLKPFESQYKVLVMWMPEMLGNEGNKLLKLIEEPPPNTLFIFVAEKEDRILPTIVSRCQIIRVPPLTTADISQALIDKLGMAEAKALQIALMSDGNFREALELLQHHQDDWNSMLRDWMNATFLRVRAGENPYAQVNKLVSDFSSLGREKQKQLLLYFLQLIEQSLRLRFIGGNYLHLPPQEAEFASRLNKVAGPSMLAALSEMLENAVFYIERNANSKLLFHSLCLQMRAILVEKKQIGLLT